MTNKWVHSSVYAYVTGVLTCYAYMMLMLVLMLMR